MLVVLFRKKNSTEAAISNKRKQFGNNKKTIEWAEFRHKNQKANVGQLIYVQITHLKARYWNRREFIFIDINVVNTFSMYEYAIAISQNKNKIKHLK